MEPAALLSASVLGVSALSLLLTFAPWPLRTDQTSTVAWARYPGLFALLVGAWAGAHAGVATLPWLLVGGLVAAVVSRRLARRAVAPQGAAPRAHASLAFVALCLGGVATATLASSSIAMDPLDGLALPSGMVVWGLAVALTLVAVTSSTLARAFAWMGLVAGLALTVLVAATLPYDALSHLADSVVAGMLEPSALLSGLLAGLIAGQAGVSYAGRPIAGLSVAPVAASVVAIVGALAGAQAGVRAFPATLRLSPLEAAHARGLRPSEFGQTFVLPEDTELKDHHVYEYVMRSNPRGHQLGRFNEGLTKVVIPDWEITKDVNELYFRTKLDVSGPHVGLDLRVPVTRTEVSISGTKLVELAPVDVDSFSKILHRYDVTGPFVPISDLKFRGAVAKAVSQVEDIGEHLAMFMEPDTQDSLALMEAVQAGFRGPYPADNQPRAPWALPAEGDELRAGLRYDVEIKAPHDGFKIGFVQLDGRLVLPRWTTFDTLSEVLLVNRKDAALTRRVPVEVERKDGRLLVRSLDPSLTQFPTPNEEWDAPRPLVGGERYQVDAVRGDRFGGANRGKVALVFVGMPGEPVPPAVGDATYKPHPAELIAAGAQQIMYADASVRGVFERGRDLLGTGGMIGMLVLALLSLAGAVAGGLYVLADRETSIRVAAVALAAPIGLTGISGTIEAPLGLGLCAAGLAVAMLLAWFERKPVT